MPLPQIDSMVNVSSGGDYKPQSTSRLSHFVPVSFVISAILLIVYGLVVCWSATAVDEDYSFTRQLMGTAVGLIIMVLIWAFDYRKLAGIYMIMLVVSVLLILSPHLPVIGVTTMGATSWINIGMQIQPGEFAKVTIVLFAAGLLAKYEGKLNDPKEYLKVVALLLIPFVCIMTQPDLGTGLVYLFIAATALVMAGARVRYLLITLGAVIVAILAIFALDELLKYQTADGSYEYRLLKQYQRSRLFVFMNQDSISTTDDAYNLKQAMIAIGSGGLLGKGLGSATQSVLGFLPEAQTDFIFCVLAEQFGFVGVMALLVLYIALIVSAIRIAHTCGNFFGMLIVCSIVGMWVFQILENIGMCCGLMPITGIPLPFVSYGSSFMIVNFAMLGLICSVYSHDKLVGKVVK